MFIFSEFSFGTALHCNVPLFILKKIRIVSARELSRVKGFETVWYKYTFHYLEYKGSVKLLSIVILFNKTI